MMKYLFSLFLIISFYSCTTPSTVLPSQNGKWAFTSHQQIIYTNNLGVKDTTLTDSTGLMIFHLQEGTFTRIIGNDTTQCYWAYNNDSKRIIVTDHNLSTRIYNVLWATSKSEKWQFEKLYDIDIDETNLVSETIELTRKN